MIETMVQSIPIERHHIRPFYRLVRRYFHDFELRHYTMNDRLFLELMISSNNRLSDSMIIDYIVDELAKLD